MLLPIGHEDTVVRRIPWVSVGIVAVCVAVQIYSSHVEADLELRAADIMSAMGEEPTHVTGPNDPRLTRFQGLSAQLDELRELLPVMRLGYRPALDGIKRMLSSVFTHAGWLHLLGNMWFLYLVGCNLEDRWGRWQFLLFYLIAGCIAALGFTVAHPESTQPLVGASGAVAGAMGAFLVCFGATKVKMFYMIVFRWGTFLAPAWLLLALWMLEQLVMTLVEVSSGSPVAYSAHAAGFVFGGTVAYLLRLTGVDSQLDEASERAAEQGRAGWSEHSLYLKAMELRDRGDHATAATTLLELVLAVPTHIAGREALLEQGLTRHDTRSIDLALPYLIDFYHRTHADERQCDVYQELRRARPEYGLTDQELLRIATAAGRRQRSEIVIRAVTELMEQHPQSAALPRAMWIAAEVQARYGSTELQRDTLQRIVARFPDHACATLAREQLSRIGVAV